MKPDTLRQDESQHRKGQLAFLPNVGQGGYYRARASAGNGPLDLSAAGGAGGVVSKTILKARRQADVEATAAAAASEARKRKQAELRKKLGGKASPVERFCAANRLEDVLAAYGYQRRSRGSDHWRSPMQTSRFVRYQSVRDQLREVDAVGVLDLAVESRTARLDSALHPPAVERTATRSTCSASSSAAATRRARRGKPAMRHGRGRSPKPPTRRLSAGCAPAN